MILRRILPAIIGLILAPTTAIVAQETSPTTPTPAANQNQIRPDRFGRRGVRARKRLAKLRMRDGLRQLNLSDEQKQQRRAILERHLSVLRSQREQLFQLRMRRMEGNLSDDDPARARTIRQELRASMNKIKGELRNTLTTDQRAQLENFRAQRRQQPEELMKQREEFRRSRPQE